MPDGHHVHNLRLAAHLDLLHRALVRLHHEDDRVAGRLQEGGHEAGMARHLVPRAQRLQPVVLAAATATAAVVGGSRGG